VKAEQDLHQQVLSLIPVPRSPRELRTRFPCQFAKLEFGFTTGWFPIFTKLCADIDRVLGHEKHAFHWLELQEKFGNHRWISTFRKSKEAEGDDIRLEVRNVIEAARSKAGGACIVCGNEWMKYLSLERGAVDAATE
jgi:hypothetical protein